MDVRVNTKNRFTKHRWVQHATTCQKHADNVKEFIHRQKQNKKPPKQTSMGSFFGACQRDNLTTEAITDNGDAGSNPPTAKRAAQLCQGVVLNPRTENILAALKLYHKYSALPDTIIMQEFGTTLCQRIFSPSCNERGIFCQKKNAGGARCENCENLRVRSGKSILENVKRRSKMFLRMLEGVLHKSHLFKMDQDDMADFLRWEDRHLSLCGIDLKTKVRDNLEFVKECLELDKKMQTKERQSAPIEKDMVESPDVFLRKFLSTYKNNPEFACSLMCGLLRAAVARLSGEKRPKRHQCAQLLFNDRDVISEII
jgi:hypothetical protein